MVGAEDAVFHVGAFEDRDVACVGPLSVEEGPVVVLEGDVGFVDVEVRVEVYRVQDRWEAEQGVPVLSQHLSEMSENDLSDVQCMLIDH